MPLPPMYGGGTVRGGYDAAQDQFLQKRAMDMQQVQGGVGILSQLAAQQERQRQLQEMEQLKPVLSQFGGDPEKTIRALLSTGNVKAIELASKLKSMMPPPETEKVVGNTLLSRPDASGARRPVFTAPAAEGAQPEVVKLTKLLDNYPEGHPARKVIEGRLAHLSGGERAPSDLSRLITERDRLPEGDPRRVTYDNAIRKASETAKQISPTIVMPRQPHAIVGVNEEGNQQVTWVKPGENATLTTKPASITTSGNQQAIRMRSEYNANPEVKLANMLEPRVRPTAEYVASVGKGMGNPVGDAELVKLWLMTTHPKGDQIGQMDYRQIQALPDLFGRVKNIAGNFAFGKTLDADTRADMWRSVSGKFKATDEVRKRVKEDVKRRAKTMGVNEEAIFSQEQ